MAYFYSPSKKGFFNSDIHASMPVDAVQLTDAEYHDLLSAQNAGHIIEPGENGSPVSVPPAHDPIIAQSNGEIMAQLVELDRKKIRAITDFILAGDPARLAQLEEQAVLLRPHLVKEL